MDKKVINPLKNSQSKKGMIQMPPIGSPRLPLASFTRPRDLLLGGVPAARLLARTNVTPNLNVVRKKQSVKIDANIDRKTQVKIERGGKTSIRGKRGAKPGLVQTVSIFSEGVGPTDVHKPSHAGASTKKREEGIGSGSRKSTGKKGDSHGEARTEDEEMDEIMDRLNDPLADINKTDHISEKGPIHLSENILPNAMRFPFSYPETVEELLSHNEPRLILMQIPEGVIPSSSDAEETNESPVKTEPTSNEDKAPTEGRIGTLRRYKSGKVEMVIDGVVFNASVGLTNGFSQHLVTIRQNEEKTFDAYNLGEVTGKLTVFPDWDKLENDKEFMDS